MIFLQLRAILLALLRASLCNSLIFNTKYKTILEFKAQVSGIKYCCVFSEILTKNKNYEDRILKVFGFKKSFAFETFNFPIFLRSQTLEYCYIMINLKNCSIKIKFITLIID